MSTVFRVAFGLVYALLVGAALYCFADGAVGSATCITVFTAWVTLSLRTMLSGTAVRSTIIGGRARPRRALSEG